MPTRRLPAHPYLAQLKRQAKELLEGQRAHDLAALQRIREFHPRFRGESDGAIAAAQLQLSDAQLAIAREYGFLSWPRLKAFVDHPRIDAITASRQALITDRLFRKAVDLLDAGDADGLRAHLRAHPEIPRMRVTFEGVNYFQNPALLDFVAENPERNGRLPPNAAEIARIILDAGGKDDRQSLDDALGLVASSSVARESGVQDELISVLCEYGADPNNAHYAAALYGEFGAVRALVRRGLPIDLLVATELNLVEDARHTVAQADELTLQKALALAAQWGYTDILDVLLDAGADPNRFAPVGGHSHATPLHQAALGGHLEAVQHLVERGARTDIRDIHHNATPLGWAQYAKQSDVVAYLEPHSQ